MVWIALTGKINITTPFNKAVQPKRVMIIVQLASQILWNNMLSKPIIMARNEANMANFWSLAYSSICLMREGLKLSITKKMMRYQPQNLAKKIETSITDCF